MPNLDHFDFARVQLAMDALDWHWLINGEERLPTIADLRETAVTLLRCLPHDEGSTAETGGLRVTRLNGQALLSFVVEERCLT